MDIYVLIVYQLTKKLISTLNLMYNMYACALQGVLYVRKYACTVQYSTAQLKLETHMSIASFTCITNGFVYENTHTIIIDPGLLH